MVLKRNLPLPQFRDVDCASITKPHLRGLGASTFSQQGWHRQARPRRCSAWTGMPLPSIIEQVRDGIAEHDPAAMFDPNPFSAYTGVRMGNAAV